MTTRETIVLVCDLCSAEGDSVHTHSLTVDGKSLEVEACGKCWAKADKALVPFIEAGRRVRRKRAA